MVVTIAVRKITSAGECEINIVKQALQQVGQVGEILELASKTKISTQELLNIGKKIIVLTACSSLSGFQAAIATL